MTTHNTRTVINESAPKDHLVMFAQGVNFVISERGWNRDQRSRYVLGALQRNFDNDMSTFYSVIEIVC